VRFDIRYRSTFAYDDIVRQSQNELRACPSSDEHQQLIAYRVTTHPAARVLSFTDYWGTRVDAFGVREPHVALEVIAEASVETSPRPLVTVSPRMSAVRTLDFRDRHVEYLSPSDHTAGGADVQAAAERVGAMAGDDAVGVVLGVHRFVNSALSYTPGATAIGVDVEEVLACGEGVCQDYAHLAISLCRTLGVPARYISGYFFTNSDATGDDVTDDVVEVQTHAWFEAAIPGFGWLALDPTNAQQVGLRHVKIGHGRDYDDVPPVKGVYAGKATPSVDALVQMRRVAAVQQQLQQQQ
jgi:transglutaminase-like putative cysteine protease